MIYTEYVDLGRCRECHICIVALDGKVSARMTFYSNRKNTYNIFMCKDTDADVVKVSHKGKRFPEYVKRVLNVLSRDEDFVEQVARCLYSTLLHSPDLLKLIQKGQCKNDK